MSYQILTNQIQFSDSIVESNCFSGRAILLLFCFSLLRAFLVHRMSKNLLAILGFALIALANGDLPLAVDKELDTHPVLIRNTEDRVYRLPENVVPLDYDIDIDLNFDATEDRAEYSYEGRVAIVIQAVEANVTELVLHSNVDRIITVSLVSNNGVPVALNSSQPFSLEPQYHFLKIHLNQVLELDTNYTLTISYYSTMNEGPLRRGIFKGYYTDANGVKRIYATTHFQPYSARQAFPCWDEPIFKATFTVHLTRPAAYGAVFTNTKLGSSDTLPNGRVRDTFLVTPRMSSYLVTFLVSETFAVIGEDTSFDPPIRVIGRSNTMGLANMTLELAVKMTEFFDQYLGIPYSTLHPNLSNDHISSPDWASAGTENWGMVSYRELYMILDPRETTMAIEHYAATLVSHEIAHKWFGNLITCYWWSNTWINEGFASYFGYIGTAAVFPEYEHDDHFNGRYLQGSLSYDSTGNMALNYEVNTPAQVTGHFGTVSYSKGASFLRMIRDMIEEPTFRKALNYFLVDKAYEPAYAEDLYAAFERAINEDGTLAAYPNFSFSDYYYTWVNEAGSPVLDVNINFATGEMSLSQERFFLSSTATPTGQIYPIPISYSTQSNPTFTSLKPTYMMTGANAVLQKDAGEEWVIFNNLQHGHYRVNYDERNWELISEALLNDINSIHYLNRAQIVDDIFAFMRSGRMTYDFGFRVLRFLRNEENFYVWDAAITGYNWLRNRLRHLRGQQAEFDAYVLSYMEHAIQTTGFEPTENETKTTALMRQTLLHFACLLGHQQCVDDSKTRFQNLRNGAWIDPSIRRNVYVVGIREGDAADYQFLLNRFLQSNYANDQLEMLRALGATRDASLINSFLELTLTEDVRQHEKFTVFGYALLGVPENANTVLEFLMNNIDRIRESYNAPAQNNPVHTVMSNMAAYLEEDGLVVYENWLHSTQVGTAQYATAVSSIASSRSNMAWGDANVEIVIGAARGSATSILVSVTMVAVAAVIALVA